MIKKAQYLSREDLEKGYEEQRKKVKQLENANQHLHAAMMEAVKHLYITITLSYPALYAEDAVHPVVQSFADNWGLNGDNCVEVCEQTQRKLDSERPLHKVAES